MFTPDADPDGLPVRDDASTSLWRSSEVRTHRVDDIASPISDGTARAIAIDWQSPNPMDSQTTRLAAGLPYYTDDLLAEIERHKALARETDLGPTFIATVGELDLLAAWASGRRAF